MNQNNESVSSFGKSEKKTTQPSSQSSKKPDPLRASRPEIKPNIPDYGQSDLDPLGSDPLSNKIL